MPSRFAISSTESSQKCGAFVTAALRCGSWVWSLHQPSSSVAFTETFEVLEGTLDVCIGGKKGHRILTSGETAVVPRRVHHRFWNSSPQTSVFTIEIRPAQHFEQALRAAFGLAGDGKVNKVGIPTNIWELALIFQ